MQLWDRLHLFAPIKLFRSLIGEFISKTDSSVNYGLKDSFQPSLWFPLFDILVDYESDRVY